LALEQRLSKADVLGLYLTLAPFGGNLEGVRAASLAYFGKEPARLSVAEGALLVAIPRSPERLRPDRHPEAARTARDRVLLRMAEAEEISPAALAEAREEDVPRLRLRCRSGRRISRGHCGRRSGGTDPPHRDRAVAAAAGRGAAET
jgi:penicillin-binding protein 1C